MRDIMMSFFGLESDSYLVFHLNEWMMHRCVCALPHEGIVRLPFGGTDRPEWSSRKENTFINQDIPYKAVFPVRTAVKGLLAKPCDKVHFFHKITCPVGQFWILVSALRYYLRLY